MEAQTKRPQTARPVPKESWCKNLDISRPRSAGRKVSFHIPHAPPSEKPPETDSFMLGRVYPIHAPSRSPSVPPSVTDSIATSEWDDFEALPENPSILLRKVATSEQPVKLIQRRPASASRPLTYIPSYSIKTQSVRFNVEKYRIEQITLRRIKHAVKVALMKTIEALKSPAMQAFSQSAKSSYISLNNTPELNENIVKTVSNRSQSAKFQSKVTTPQSILDMLAEVEKYNKRKQKKKVVNGKITICDDGDHKQIKTKSVIKTK
ncbi:hypothetical protein HK103_007035 [Boothiomyces macroporosus]|uniref:Uncharacterized protein n=1 Tax=Boothiomyces macroporosus TaxID=261099 RepID=A0AAD5UGC2_9FUNG|nr:hypothetical protein HK103_007035 [Boothiomyces macroporosus]